MLLSFLSRLYGVLINIFGSSASLNLCELQQSYKNSLEELLIHLHRYGSQSSYKTIELYTKKIVRLGQKIEFLDKKNKAELTKENLTICQDTFNAAQLQYLPFGENTKSTII
jgi:hypothetical protein